MKPIYFPFTYAPDRVTEALAACFGSVVIYQPLAGELPEQMQSWVDKEVLDVRVPLAEGQKALMAAAKNYQDWVNLHLQGAGTKAASLKALKDTLSSSGRLLSSHIVADIKRKVHGSTSTGRPDPLTAAGVFLYFAQQFDWQCQQVDGDLTRYRQKEAGLIRALKMEDDVLAGEFQKNEMQIPNTSADYLVQDRLAAWAQLFLKDTECSGLFVTHSPTTLEYLLDSSSAAEKVLQIESIPPGVELTPARDSWRCHLAADLTRIVESNWPLPDHGWIDVPAFPAAQDTVSLSFYLFPNQLPHEIFSRCAEIQPFESDPPYRKGRINNTLIGLIEI